MKKNTALIKPVDIEISPPVKLLYFPYAFLSLFLGLCFGIVFFEAIRNFLSCFNSMFFIVHCVIPFIINIQNQPFVLINMGKDANIGGR